MKFKELFVLDKDGNLDISDPKNLIVNWEAVEKIPQFIALKNTPQNVIWHREGNAWNHTKMVTEAMYKLLNNKIKGIRVNTNEIEPAICRDYANFILMCAALCHDLGKAGNTIYNEKTQNWKCVRHGFHGEIITRELFYDDDIRIRESVCALVRSHMVLHHIFDEENKDKIDSTLIQLSQTPVPIQMFIALVTADSLGCINDEDTPEFVAEHANKIRRYAQQNHVLTRKYYRYEWISGHDCKRILALDGNGIQIPDEYKINNDKLEMSMIYPKMVPTLHVICGLPSIMLFDNIENILKETKHPNELAVVYSDYASIELSLRDQETKGKLYNEDVLRFSDEFHKYLDERRTIILSKPFIYRAERMNYILQAICRGYQIIIHVVEPPTIDDLYNQYTYINTKPIDMMRKNFEFPSTKECNGMFIHHYRRNINGELVLDSRYVGYQDYLIDQMLNECDII